MPSSFQFRPYTSSAPQTIADIMLRSGDQQAAALRASGEATARGAAQIGQDAAGAIQQYRDAPIRALQLRNLQNQATEGDLQLQARRRAMLGPQVLAAAMQQYGDDPEKVGKFLVANGFPDVAEGYAKTKEVFAKLKEGTIKTQTDADQFEGEVLDNISHLPTERRQGAWSSALGRFKARGIDTSSLSPIWDDAQAAEQIASTKKPTADYSLGPGTVRVSGATNQPIATGGAAPVTEAQLDAQAQALYAKKAAGQPLAPAESAALTAYEARKRVVSDPALISAQDRQSAAIAAQTAQQGRAQTFTEQQAGKKELTDQVERPYQTALASANTMRDVVAAAQAGNKVAGSLQSLETTMAAIRAQGLNRINTAEIGVTANAGNLWDRIVGGVGKLTSGEPVPPDLQKDMTRFADILEKAAYKKYLVAHQTTTKRYHLTDETPLPAPGSGISVTAPDGSVHPFETQAQADAFKKLAGIK